MFKRLCVVTAAMSLAAAATVNAETVQSKYNLSIGGYVKLDYAHNSNGVGPLSPATGLPGTARTGIAHKDESIITAKQSRFWLRVAGPEFYGAKTNGLIEADFYGAGAANNENPNLRMRLAYGTLDWANTQLLFGQFWDIFSPATADTVDFRQGGSMGAPQNPRLPQIRLTHKLNFNDNNGMRLVFGVLNPLQNNAAPGAGASTFATGYGSTPNVAGQVMFVSKALGVSPGVMGLSMNPLQVGLFGQYGTQKTNAATASATVQGVGAGQSVDSYGYGVYAFVPVLKSSDGKSRAMTLSLEAQAYIAAGLPVQQATAMAFTGPAANVSAAKGYGAFGQLKFYPTQDLGVTAGYMRRNAMNYDDYRTTVTPSGTFEEYNALAYGNITYDLNAAVRVATEYEHHKTQYGAQTATARDNGQNNVVRAAMYYFF